MSEFFVAWLFLPRIIAVAVMIIMTANSTIRIAPGMNPPTMPPANAPAMPAIPKSSPVFHRTLPALA